MSNRIGILTAAALAAVAFSAPALATPQSAHLSSCFRAGDWQAWKSPTPTVIYVRVAANQVFRLDLSSGSNQLDEPDVHLTSHIRGSDWVCSPLDLQLEVVATGGFREPLIVSGITQLTPQEIAAIPTKYRP